MERVMGDDWTLAEKNDGAGDEGRITAVLKARGRRRAGVGFSSSAAVRATEEAEDKAAESLRGILDFRRARGAGGDIKKQKLKIRASRVSDENVTRRWIDLRIY